MEEVIGKVWNKFIVKKVTNTYDKQKVFLKDKKKTLKIFYHLLGGDRSKEILITDKRKIFKKRNILEKIAGMGNDYFLPWQDENALYLPSFIASFPKKEDNEMLYFWLIAMMSKKTISQTNFFLQNIHNSNALIQRYTGFKEFYERCSEKLIETNKDLSFFKSFDQEDLKNEELSLSPYDFWIYPALNRKTKFEEFQEQDDKKEKTKEKTKTETLEMKKQVNQLDDKKKSDGLFVFLPDALLSILEQINVDRSEDDSFDEDALYNATDLDEITLARKKANLNSRIKMDLDIEVKASEDVFLGKGFYLDEWDYSKNDYIKNYVCIRPIIKNNIKAIVLPKRLKKIVKRVQNELDLMQIDKIKKDNLLYGDELNINAWVDYKTSLNKNEHKQNFFTSYEKKTRSMSTLILADVSLSTEAGITSELSIIDMIKDSLMVFSEALTRLEDKFSIYAFSSLKNTRVQFHIIKNFKEKYSSIIRGRIEEIKPGYYTRLGAAIRQSTKILQKEASNNKLLLIISDGKPNDVDKYDGRYGIEDTKKAITEAKAKGITPFCVTIDLEAKDYLAHLFGKNGYVLIKNSKNLPKTLSDIYINLTK